MSDKTVIIKCNLMLSVDKIREVRESVLRQMEDGVVILPVGFELAQVDVSLLEKIKAEIDDMLKSDEVKNDKWANVIINKSYLFKRIINNHISELKGENNE